MAILNTCGATGETRIYGEMAIAFKAAGASSTAITFTGLRVTNTPSFYMIALTQGSSASNNSTAYYIYDNGNVKQVLYKIQSSSVVLVDGTSGGYAWTVSFNSAGECAVASPIRLPLFGMYCLYYKVN